MTDQKPEEWEDVYLQALQEPLDSAALPQRLTVAEIAIFSRVQLLVPGPETFAERHALAQALRSLNYVRKSAADPSSAKFSSERHGIPKLADGFPRIV